MNLTKIMKNKNYTFISENFFLYFYLLIPTVIMFSKFFSETLILILILFILFNLFNLFKKKLFNNIFVWDHQHNLLKIANAFFIFFISLK